MTHTITIPAGEHRTIHVPTNVTDIEYYIEQDARCTIIDDDVSIVEKNIPPIVLSDFPAGKIVSKDTRITFYCAQNAELTYYLSLSRAQHAIKEICVVLQGPHARATIRGVYILQGSQQIAVKTRQEHHAPDTYSDLLIKGVLSDSAKAVYEGTIYIDYAAHRASAYQYNKNLLMGSQAHAKSIPALEVLTNNVSCKHGSAAGQPDPLQLLYVQSRGVSVDSAHKLLVQGFIADVLKDPLYSLFNAVALQNGPNIHHYCSD